MHRLCARQLAVAQSLGLRHKWGKIYSAQNLHLAFAAECRYKTKTSLETNKEEQATVQAGREEEGTSSEQGQQKPMPMNILILYPEDWRHDLIGSEKPYVPTPFLDQLAREGIRFTHNAVTCDVMDGTSRYRRSGDCLASAGGSAGRKRN